jgi:hypothetical protein
MMHVCDIAHVSDDAEVSAPIRMSLVTMRGHPISGAPVPCSTRSFYPRGVNANPKLTYPLKWSAPTASIKTAEFSRSRIEGYAPR